MSSDKNKRGKSLKPTGNKSDTKPTGTESDFWDLDSKAVQPDDSDPPVSLSGQAAPDPSLPEFLETSGSLPDTQDQSSPDDEIARPVPIPDPTPEPVKNPPSYPEITSESPTPGLTSPGDLPPAPDPSRKHFFASLSTLEKIAVFSLLAALIIGIVMAFSYFNRIVPTRSLVGEKIDYPVSGEFLTVNSTSTYWRAPRTDGDSPDTVRRGTRLIPVLKISIDAKSSAIRVLFRDQDKKVVGDGITRLVSGNMDLEIPATAGFDDTGMHAAYRTGESPPWTFQILEGPGLAADRAAFKKVLETEISTDVE